MNTICDEKSASVISTYNDGSLFIYKPQCLFSPASRKLNGSKYSTFIISICQVVKLNTLKNKQRCNIIQFRGLQGGYVNIVRSKMAPPNCKSSLFDTQHYLCYSWCHARRTLSLKKRKSFLMVLKRKTISIFYSSQVAIIFLETLSKKCHPVLPSDF